MTAQTVVFLLLLVLIKDSSCAKSPFQIEATALKTVEGSCAELKCSVTSTNVFQTVNAYWFWIKDGIYIKNHLNFTGTIIYSTNTQERPVSTDYQGRVNYTGSLLTSRENGPLEPTCGVVICNLTKSDSGVYAARVIVNENKKWMSENSITLKVTENPCPITFEKPPVAKDSSTIPLKCSTLMSCPSDLEMRRSTQLLETKSQPNEGKMKSIDMSLTVNWQDNGKEVSCQIKDNKDPYLIQKTRLTVQYAPREVSAVMSPEGTVKENQPLTIKCNAQGNPNPTFTWFVNDTEKDVGEELKFDSIKASQSGEYTCEASNILGSLKSSLVSIDVNYPPEVKVTTSSAHEVTEGGTVSLTCNVTRSKPEPSSYSWYKVNKWISTGQTLVVARVTPENRGPYTCKATNSVGTGTSAQHQIQVRYRPRKAQIAIDPNKIQVKVGEPLTLTCSAEAYPSALSFSWYRYHTDRNRQTDHSKWMPPLRNQDNLRLEKVERSDDACYVCNATNDMGTGEKSEPMCIQVLYPPNIPRLFMVNLINESQPTTISCTVESYPPSKLTLRRTFGSNSAKEVFIHPRDTNTLNYEFYATSADKGSYTCVAENDIGSTTSVPKELVVNYRPQGVTVKYQPSVVNENTKLVLSCSALSSYPPVKSFTWTKMKGGNPEGIGNSPTLTIKSVSPSDSGKYGCTAWNEMGDGKSEKVEIKVRYAPKVTKITREAEQQLPSGKSSVTLSCFSESYPEVKTYLWFKKEQDGDERVSNQRTHTVLSDQPGDYYCIAKNDINEKSSEPIQMFVDRSFVKILIIFFLLMILVVLMFLIIYRRRKSRSTQRGNTNTPSSLGSRDWWNSIGRRNQPTIAFRSRDDLLTDQQPRSRGQRRQQPRPDNTSATNSNAVYYIVNLPASQQGPSGEMPVKQKAQHTQDESLNYASLHFKNKEKKKKERAEVNAVYAVVSETKTPKKTGGENQEDYENLKTAHTAKSPNPPDSDSDSDTSEDEVELNYSQVSFKLKPGHQRTKSDSSSTSSTSSEEEETQYSQVKI